MHQKLEFTFCCFYLLPPHHCFFGVLLTKHILACLQRKGKAKLEKRKKKDMKDQKETITLIKGGMLVGVCMRCAHAFVCCTFIPLYPKHRSYRQTGNKLIFLLHSFIDERYTFRVRYYIIIIYIMLLLE